MTNTRKTYSGMVTRIKGDQIFVFGSNTEGRHGKGAALWAVKNAGAIYGVARGRQGRSYAIVTKDLMKKVHPSIPRVSIVSEISALYEYARQNEELDFLVAYSGTGTNLNAYSNQEMADMFRDAAGDELIPDNIIFEIDFCNLVIAA